VSYHNLRQTVADLWRFNAFSNLRPSAVLDFQNKLNFWVTVCKTVHRILSDRCLSVCLSCLSILSCAVLSVTLVYCGQTVGWIKMKLGMQVGLCPGHSVLGGNPGLHSQRGTAPPQFSAHVCYGQTAGWIKMALGMEVGIGLGHIVLDGNAAPLPQKRDRAPNFWPISPFLLCQTAGCIKILLGMEVGLSPGDFV